jgi:carbon-monoxide dehydrogenase medium subunit
MDIAVVGAGVDLTLGEDGVCTRAKVALGAVAERVLVVEDAAAALVGTKIDEAALAALAAAASAACRPINDKRGTIEFRTDVAGVLAKRAAPRRMFWGRSAAECFGADGGHLPERAGFTFAMRDLGVPAGYEITASRRRLLARAIR